MALIKYQDTNLIVDIDNSNVTISNKMELITLYLSRGVSVINPRIKAAPFKHRRHTKFLALMMMLIQQKLLPANWSLQFDAPGQVDYKGYVLAKSH